MIMIDGSLGEGGGQILRTSLALSMVTGQPFRIQRIRANRPKPGLMRQHLTCVDAACEISSGEATGASLGSCELTFTPGPIRGGEYSFAIGSAGSTTLVLQTVLPALMTTSETSSLTITGGTHNTHAPSVHFLQLAFLPLLRRMGPVVRVDLERHGFYPAGGGRIRTTIEPVARLRPIEIDEAGPVVSRRAVATVAGLPDSVGNRELSVVRKRLGWAEDELLLDVLNDQVGPGNILSLEIRRDAVTEVFTGFGERRVSAEAVASRAVKQACDYLAHDVPVWSYLADQLMLPLALAHGGGFATGPLSMHAETNAQIIERFLPVKIHRETSAAGSSVVRVLQ